MAKGLSRQQLLQYARAGAEKRIAELRAELAALEGAFGGRGKGRTAGRKRKSGISAEGRKKIADAARKRWAKWRAEKKSK